LNKCIAIIPARGGSKRIPRKNIKLFCNKPLIAYSIEVALQSGLFDEVIVSTDDEEIAKISQEYGAKIPFVRPKELSDDFVGTSAVIEHAINFLKNQAQKIDFICTIYATAFLNEKYLIKAYEELKNSNAKNAFSCTRVSYPIWRTFKITSNGRCQMFWRENFSKRSQDLREAYHDAGQFYWTNLNIKSDEIIFGKDSIPIILPQYLVQDIDTLEDWRKAEIMYEVIKRSQK